MRLFLPVLLGILACGGPTASPAAPGDTRAPEAAATPADSAEPPSRPAPPALAIQTENGSAPAVERRASDYTVYAVEGAALLGDLRLPPELDGFERVMILGYEDPDLGYLASYERGRELYVTFYLYGRGGDAAAEMIDVEAAMRSQHPDLEGSIDADFALELGGQPRRGQYARHRFRREGTLVDSHTLLFDLGDRYLKVRGTGLPESWGDDPMAVVTKLLEGVNAPAAIAGAE